MNHPSPAPRENQPASRLFYRHFGRLAAIVGMFVALLGLYTSQAAAQTTHILMLGDSITAGYGLGSRDALPQRLEAALRDNGLDVRLINAGVSGDTTAGGRARVAWSLGGTPKPDAAIVALGGNDGLRGLDPAAMKQNLDHIISSLKQAGLPVLLAGMKAPRNFGPDYAREYDAVFPDLVKEHDVLFYPFLLDGVALLPAMNQPDQIHPNERGVARIVDGLLPHVEKLVARARKAAQ